MSRKLVSNTDVWPEDADVSPEDLYVELPNDETFHIGQHFSGIAVETISCRRCAGRQFNVGSSNYYTAIRCVKCEWEAMIHEG